MNRREVLVLGGGATITLLAGCSELGDSSSANLGGSFGKVELRQKQILVEVTEYTMDWVRATAPNEWQDEIPVGGTGTGTFSRREPFTAGEYTIEALDSGDLDEDPFVVETHTAELTPKSPE